MARLILQQENPQNIKNEIYKFIQSSPYFLHPIFFHEIFNKHIFGHVFQIIGVSWKHFLKSQVSTVILMYFEGLWNVTRPQGGPSKKIHIRRFFHDFSVTPGLRAIKLVSTDAPRQYASIGMHYNLYPIKIEVTSSKKRNFNFLTKNRRAFRTFAAKMEFF